MKKPPCIRNLKRFEHKGCPEKLWDGEDGCPCWIEMSIGTRKDPDDKKIRKQCLDKWMWQFNWSMLGLLEGNQEAVESFRNGMVENGPDGKTYPKPDPAVVELLKIYHNLEERQKLIFEHESRKRIEQ